MTASADSGKAPRAGVQRRSGLGTCEQPMLCAMAMIMNKSQENQALRLIKRMGLARPAKLETHGVSRTQLYRLVREGPVERRSRWISVVVEQATTAEQQATTAEHSVAQVAKRVPAGVLCLLTALPFHDLTTPLSEKAREPRLEYPRLREARFSGAALTEGVETRHRRRGGPGLLRSKDRCRVPQVPQQARGRARRQDAARLQLQSSRTRHRSCPLRSDLPRHPRKAALPGCGRVNAAELDPSVRARLLQRGEQAGLTYRMPLTDYPGNWPPAGGRR
jgi:hypothetical protein